MKTATLKQQEITNKAEKAGWSDLTWTDVRRGVIDGSFTLMGFPPGDNKLGLKTAFPGGTIEPLGRRIATPHPSTTIAAALANGAPVGNLNLSTLNA